MTGSAFSKVNPDSAGLDPSWRKATGHLVTGISWNEDTSTVDLNSLKKTAASNFENARDDSSPYGQAESVEGSRKGA